MAEIAEMPEMAKQVKGPVTAQHQNQSSASANAKYLSTSTRTIRVDVVSAEEEIFSGQANFVVLPGIVGELGILPGHIPLITRIRPGTVRIEAENSEEVLVFVAGGILEIQPNVVTVLADTAIRGQDLDEAKAEQARRQAEETLQNAHSNIEYAIAQSELAHATAQLAALQRLRQRRR